MRPIYNPTFSGYEYSAPETRARNVDLLLAGNRTIVNDSNTQADLIGETLANQPTLSQCEQYHTLIWDFRKNDANPFAYQVLVRPTDASGVPFGSEWRVLIDTTTVTGAAGEIQRVVITDGTHGLYYPQIRIRVWRTTASNAGIDFTVRGVRR